MRGRLSSMIKTAAFAATCLTAAAVAEAAPYSDIVVFGDSVVDAGNIAALNPAWVPASKGYYQGRSSDGPVYTDLLYRDLFGTDMTRSTAGGTNYAYGGARVVDNSGFAVGGDAIPDLKAQIDSYVAKTGGTADADALYIVNMTGNDFVGLLSNTTGGLSAQDYADLVASTLREQIVRLDDLGVRHILMTDVPNTNFPQGFLLQDAIDAAFAGLMIEAKLMTFSWSTFYTSLLADPTSVGLPSDLITSVNCLAAETPAPDIDCSNYYFFDSGHATTTTHRAAYWQIADIVGIAQVPEPATGALLGIGMAAVIVRRRRPFRLARSTRS